MLGLIVAEEMFRRLEGDEGKLTRARASVVSTAALAGAARRLMLGDLLRMSDAAQRSGDNQRDKVLADAFESMVALAYEELGLEGARAFVLRHLAQELDVAAQGGAALTNPKSALSESCQERNGQPPEYRLVGRTGPDRARPQGGRAVGSRRRCLWRGRRAKSGTDERRPSGDVDVVRRDVMSQFVSGYCAIVGRPNAGKSTL